MSRKILSEATKPLIDVATHFVQTNANTAINATVNPLLDSSAITSPLLPMLSIGERTETLRDATTLSNALKSSLNKDGVHGGGDIGGALIHLEALEKIDIQKIEDVYLPLRNIQAILLDSTSVLKGPMKLKLYQMISAYSLACFAKQNQIDADQKKEWKNDLEKLLGLVSENKNESDAPYLHAYLYHLECAKAAVTLSEDVETIDWVKNGANLLSIAGSFFHLCESQGATLAKDCFLFIKKAIEKGNLKKWYQSVCLLNTYRYQFINNQAHPDLIANTPRADILTENNQEAIFSVSLLEVQRILTEEFRTKHIADWQVVYACIEALEQALISVHDDHTVKLIFEGRDDPHLRCYFYKVTSHPVTTHVSKENFKKLLRSDACIQYNDDFYYFNREKNTLDLITKKEKHNKKLKELTESFLDNQLQFATDAQLKTIGAALNSKDKPLNPNTHKNKKLIGIEELMNFHSITGVPSTKNRWCCRAKMAEMLKNFQKNYADDTTAILLIEKSNTLISQISEKAKANVVLKNDQSSPEEYFENIRDHYSPFETPKSQTESLHSAINSVMSSAEARIIQAVQEMQKIFSQPASPSSAKNTTFSDVATNTDANNPEQDLRDTIPDKIPVTPIAQPITEQLTWVGVLKNLIEYYSKMSIEADRVAFIQFWKDITFLSNPAKLKLINQYHEKLLPRKKYLSKGKQRLIQITKDTAESNFSSQSLKLASLTANNIKSNQSLLQRFLPSFLGQKNQDGGGRSTQGESMRDISNIDHKNADSAMSEAANFEMPSFEVEDSEKLTRIEKWVNGAYDNLPTPIKNNESEKRKSVLEERIKKWEKIHKDEETAINTFKARLLNTSCKLLFTAMKSPQLWDDETKRSIKTYLSNPNLSLSDKKQDDFLVDIQNAILADDDITENTTQNKKLYKKVFTKGDGDCAFHAALGTLNASGNYEASDIQGKRKKVADTIIKNCSSDITLFDLVKPNIIEMVMSSVDQDVMQYPRFIKLKADYKKYLLEVNQQENDRQAAFEVELNKFPAIIDTINAFLDQYIADKKLNTSDFISLKSKYATYEAEYKGDSKNQLENLIVDETLKKAYLEYKKLTPEIDWDVCIKNNASLLREYADYISKKGQWLLPSELQIIAYVFDIHIVFYNGAAEQEHYNFHGKKEVHISFNGINHYERMICVGVEHELDTLPEFIYQFYAAKTNESNAQWKNIISGLPLFGVDFSHWISLNASAFDIKFIINANEKEKSEFLKILMCQFNFIVSHMLCHANFLGESIVHLGKTLPYLIQNANALSCELQRSDILAKERAEIIASTVVLIQLILNSSKFKDNMQHVDFLSSKIHDHNDRYRKILKKDTNFLSRYFRLRPFKQLENSVVMVQNWLPKLHEVRDQRNQIAEYELALQRKRRLAENDDKKTQDDLLTEQAGRAAERAAKEEAEKREAAAQQQVITERTEKEAAQQQALISFQQTVSLIMKNKFTTLEEDIAQFQLKKTLTPDKQLEESKLLKDRYQTLHNKIVRIILATPGNIYQQDSIDDAISFVLHNGIPANEIEETAAESFSAINWLIDSDQETKSIAIHSASPRSQSAKVRFFDPAPNAAIPASFNQTPAPGNEM